MSYLGFFLDREGQLNIRLPDGSSRRASEAERVDVLTSRPDVVYRLGWRN